MSERERRGAGHGAAPGKGNAGTAAGVPGKTTLVEQAYAIQRKATGAAPATRIDAVVDGASSTSGTPVDSGVRGRVESSTGARLVADAVVSNRHAGPIQATSAPIARQTKPPATLAPHKPSGRHEVTDFGEYWVVPELTSQCFADAHGEQITETEFAVVKTAWDKVKDGSGNIKITENDKLGTAHAGFKASITVRIGMLMSAPTGRQLVTSLLSGGFDVTIRPSLAKLLGGGTSFRGDAGSLEKADGSAGTGATTIIEIDPACTDDDIKAFNKNGVEIPDPVYIFLGHEMIHARHNQLGRNRRGLAATDPAKYPNREEEATIATGAGITENQLRAEHGLDARAGHTISDKRP